MQVNFKVTYILVKLGHSDLLNPRWSLVKRDKAIDLRLVKIETCQTRDMGHMQVNINLGLQRRCQRRNAIKTILVLRTLEFKIGQVLTEDNIARILELSPIMVHYFDIVKTRNVACFQQQLKL